MATQIKKRPLITGKTFKAFWNDETFFFKGVTVDDVLVHVDGKPFDSEAHDFNSIADESVVAIESGDVFEGGSLLQSLEDHYNDFAAQSVTQDCELTESEEAATQKILSQIKKNLGGGMVKPEPDDAHAELEAAIKRFVVKCRKAASA